MKDDNKIKLPTVTRIMDADGVSITFAAAAACFLAMAALIGLFTLLLVPLPFDNEVRLNRLVEKPPYDVEDRAQVQVFGCVLVINVLVSVSSMAGCVWRVLLIRRVFRSGRIVAASVKQLTLSSSTPRFSMLANRFYNITISYDDGGSRIERTFWVHTRSIAGSRFMAALTSEHTTPIVVDRSNPSRFFATHMFS